MKVKEELTRAIMALIIITGTFIPVTITVCVSQPVQAVTSLTTNLTINGEGFEAGGAYSGGSNYTVMNDDNDATYLAISAAEGAPPCPGIHVERSWNFTDMPGSGGTITNLTVKKRVNCSFGGYSTGEIYYRDPSTGIKYTGTAYLIESAYPWYTYGSYYSINPATGQNWTLAEVNNASFGIGVHPGCTSTATLQCSKYWITVDYIMGIPTVTSSVASNVLYVSNFQAQFNGAITDVNGVNCTNYGFVYDTVSHTDPGNVTVGASGYAYSWSVGAGNYGISSFSRNITGLQEGTTYYYRSYAVNSQGYDYSNDQQSFTNLQSVVTTGAASGVGYSGSHIATLSGTLAPAGITWSQRGFAYGTASNTTTPSNVTPPASYTTNVTTSGTYTNGSYSINLSGLLEGRTYYFRAYAKDSDGYWWSSTQNSWTALSHPNITTVATTEVGSTSVKLQGALTWDGGQACDVRFGYDTSSHATVATYGNQTGWVEDTYLTGSAPQQYIYGLTPGQTYYFRAVARNDVTGDKDALNELTFTTATGVNPPTSLTASPTATSILLSWIRGTGSTTTVVRYKLLEYPTSTSDGTLLANTTASSALLSGLTAGTTYYFRTWGWSGGTYSSSNTTVLSTTVAGTTTNTTSSNYTAPARWYQNATGSGFAENPFRSVVNDTAVAYQMPEATVWMILSLLLSMAAGIWIYSQSSNLVLSLITVGAGIGFSALMGLLPMWVLFAYVVFALAIVVISTRYGG